MAPKNQIKNKIIGGKMKVLSKSFVFLIMSTIIFGGCVPIFTGSKIRNLQTDESWLVDKKTTKSEILQHIGVPDEKKTLQGIRHWIYTGSVGFTIIGAGGDTTDYTLDFMFNEGSNVLQCRQYYFIENGTSTTGSAYQVNKNMIEDTCSKIVLH
jgi:hypothetical protein